MQNRFNHFPSFETASSAREIGLDDRLISDDYHAEYSRMTKHLPLHTISANHYLSSAQKYLSNLVPTDNLKEILSLARYFPGNLTSFLGFECRLGEQDRKADWAFAISGVGHERQVFTNFLNNGYFPDHFFDRQEWQQIKDFSIAWADPKSTLHEKVQCFWLEFDMPSITPVVHIPSVFFGPAKPSKNNHENDAQNYLWITRTALPLLTSKNVEKSVENNFIQCIQQLPKNASIQFVGSMFSRSSYDIRLYVNRLLPHQIPTYLIAIGWKDKTNEFFSIFSELADKADRFVLGFDITQNGIGPRIGIECSFQSNEFHRETRWGKLLEDLVEKGLCLPEKRDALLQYSGTDNEGDFSGGVMKPLASASNQITDLLLSKLVRYISHIKLVYQAGFPLEAKAYPAVRLFSLSEGPSYG